MATAKAPLLAINTHGDIANLLTIRRQRKGPTVSMKIRSTTTTSTRLQQARSRISYLAARWNKDTTTLKPAWTPPPGQSQISAYAAWTAANAAAWARGRTPIATPTTTPAAYNPTLTTWLATSTNEAITLTIKTTNVGTTPTWGAEIYATNNGSPSRTADDHRAAILLVDGTTTLWTWRPPATGNWSFAVRLFDDSGSQTDPTTIITTAWPPQPITVSGLVAEDGTTLLTAEDGTTILIPEA